MHAFLSAVAELLVYYSGKTWKLKEWHKPQCTVGGNTQVFYLMPCYSLLEDLHTCTADLESCCISPVKCLQL